MQSKAVLILEDNPAVLAVLTSVIRELADTAGTVIHIITHATVRAAAVYFAEHPGQQFDAVLLDRNDRDGASFHDLPFESLGLDKVISISSVPRHNAAALRRGAAAAVDKEYEDISAFAAAVQNELEAVL